MASSRKASTATEAWRQSFNAIRRLPTLYPFLFYAFLQMSLLIALVYFAYPPFSKVLVPLMKSMFGEPALHYPNNYIVLVPLFEWGNILLSGLVGAFMVGVATYLFAVRENETTSGLIRGIRQAGRRYLLLVVVWFVETALILGAVAGIPALADKLTQPAYAMSRLIQYGSLFVAVLFGALFAYTTALIVLSRKGLFSAIRESLRIFAVRPLATVTLIAVPTVMRMPVEFLARRAPMLVQKFNPEIMIAVVFLSILVSLFANYLLVGSVTYFFLSQTAKR